MAPDTGEPKALGLQAWTSAQGEDLASGRVPTTTGSRCPSAKEKARDEGALPQPKGVEKAPGVNTYMGLWMSLDLLSREDSRTSTLSHGGWSCWVTGSF